MVIYLILVKVILSRRFLLNFLLGFRNWCYQVSKHKQAKGRKKKKKKTFCPIETKSIKSECQCKEGGQICKGHVFYGVSFLLLHVGFPLEVQKLQNYWMQVLHRKHDLYFLYQYLHHPTQPNTGESEKMEVLLLFLNLPKSCH